MKHSILPLLLGFLLLGGASQAPARHGHANANAKDAQAAAPAQPAAPMPRLLRTFADGDAAMQVIQPLPAYVPDAGDRCERACAWPI
jgi:hypothetical protein